MKIEVENLKWIERCCGCSNNILPTQKTYMISGVWGIPGSIHLCEECIDKIIKSKED